MLHNAFNIRMDLNKMEYKIDDLKNIAKLLTGLGNVELAVVYCEFLLWNAPQRIQ